MGHNISCFFFPSCGAFSASFILLLNSSNVSSISSNPSGGGLRLREVRTGGMVGSVFRLTEGTLEIDENRRYRILSNMNTVDLTVWWFLLGLLVGNNTHKSGLSWKVIRGSFFAATHRLLVLREVRTCSDWWIWAKNSNSQFPLFKLRFQTNWALPIPILFEDVDYITFFPPRWTLHKLSSTSPSSAIPIRRNWTSSWTTKPRSRTSSRVSEMLCLFYMMSYPTFYQHLPSLRGRCWSSSFSSNS